jgi:peroxiredoxin
MKRNRLATIVLLSIALLVVGCASDQGPEPSENDAQRAAPVEGALAPDLQLTDLEGELVRLSDLHGRPVLLNFWTTWCAFCRAERAILQELHEQYAGDGLAVLAVAIGEEPTLLRNFAEDKGLTHTILLDGDGHAARRYQVRNIPASFFIDRQGVIQAQHVGPLGEELLPEYLERVQ